MNVTVNTVARLYVEHKSHKSIQDYFVAIVSSLLYLWSKGNYFFSMPIKKGEALRCNWR